MNQLQAIKAEIERRLKANGAFDEEGDSAWHYDQGMIEAYQSILSFIESLEKEPEVDLEKEIQEYWYLHQYEHRLRRQVMDGHGKSVLRNVARHFFELGLSARKEVTL